MATPFRTRAMSMFRDVGRTAVRTLAMATAAARRGPDVVIIGTKRGGTTSLFRDLERHVSMCPLVPSARRLPLRTNMKGVHYFDSNAHRPWRWYVSHFATEVTKRRLAARTGAAFTAEASPYYLFHPRAAARAVVALPATTIFVAILRDPVERTVSHWSEQTRNGVETLPLEAALDAEARRLGDDHDRLTSGALASSHAHEHQSYVAQSRYTESLRRWFDAAGRDRVLVVFAEHYATDSAAVIDAITDRINVPPSASRSGEHRNAAPRTARLDHDLDLRLTEEFRIDVAALTTLLGVAPPWPRFVSSRSLADLPKSL